MRKFWHDREDEYLATYPKLLKEAAATWETDPTAAMEKLTEFTVAAQRKDFADAKRVFDQLMWYITANNRIEGDGSGATDKPERPFTVK